MFVDWRYFLQLRAEAYRHFDKLAVGSGEPCLFLQKVLPIFFHPTAILAQQR